MEMGKSPFFRVGRDERDICDWFFGLIRWECLGEKREEFDGGIGRDERGYFGWSIDEGEIDVVWEWSKCSWLE